MLNFTGGLKIFVALTACNMRAGAGTLQGLVAERLKDNIRDGALFVFTNKRRTVLKMLYWDGTGVWVMAKRLEKGRFTWPVGSDRTKLSMTPEALTMLLAGIDLKDGCKKAWYES